MPAYALSFRPRSRLFLLVPLHHPDLAEYTAVAGGAEVQTLALILRRRLRREAPGATVLARMVSVWHDVSFVLIRLVLHPLLLFGFWTVMDVGRTRPPREARPHSLRHRRSPVRHATARPSRVPLCSCLG